MINTKSTPFLQPMSPWPELADFARKIHLEKSEVDLFYYELGKPGSRTIFLIHGLGDEADTWRYLVQPLATRGHVIAIDLPGFGRSSKTKRRYSQAFLGQVVEELFAALSIDQALLIGHSMGARISHQFAIDHPKRTTGLVLIDGSLVLQPQGLNIGLLLFLIPRIGEWIYTRLRKDPQKAYDTLRPYYSDITKLSSQDRDFLYIRVNQRVWSDEQRWAYFSTLRNLALIAGEQKEIKSKLAGLQVPTLVIWGQDDQIASTDSAFILQRTQPNVRVEIIQGAGHNVQQEGPEKLLSVIFSDERFGL